jgi:hypothetical protein
MNSVSCGDNLLVILSVVVYTKPHCIGMHVYSGPNWLVRRIEVRNAHPLIEEPELRLLASLGLSNPPMNQ